MGGENWSAGLPGIWPLIRACSTGYSFVSAIAKHLAEKTPPVGLLVSQEIISVKAVLRSYFNSLLYLDKLHSSLAVTLNTRKMAQSIQSVVSVQTDIKH